MRPLIRTLFFFLALPLSFFQIEIAHAGETSAARSSDLLAINVDIKMLVLDSF